MKLAIAAAEIANRLALALSCAAACSVISVARGDVYELETGGEVEGSLLERRKDGAYVIQTAEGAQVVLAKSQVKRIEQVDEKLAEYRRRAHVVADTPDGQRELARWCKENGLADEADVHFQRLLELVPDDQEAREGLGYRKVAGHWMTREEQMAARGMVFFDGRYRTAQDVAIRKREAAQGTTEADWIRDLRLWRGWLDSRRPDQVAKGHAHFESLDDPSAVPALVRLLDREENDATYSELLKVLGRFDHPEAVRTLVDVSLFDPDPDQRALALELLTRDGRQVPLLPYLKALKHADNKIVNRAGKALAEIGDPEAVSPLIDALVTEHKYLVQPANPGGINAGAVNGNAGFSAGGNGPKVVRRAKENAEVLRALATLTHQTGFEYDEQAWRNWFVNEQARALSSARRDE